MTYDEWERTVPECLRRDSAWRMRAYRLALFLSDLAWSDVNKLAGDRRTAAIADQLCRATGKVSSNIVEGYSRGTGKDRARLYEYALGSTRESREWYYKGRHVLGEAVAYHRMDLCTEIVRLMLTMVARERRDNRRLTTSRGTDED